MAGPTRQEAAAVLRAIVSMAVGAGLQPLGAAGRLGTAGILGSGPAQAGAPFNRELNRFMAKEYPTEFAPDVNHSFDVQWIDAGGKANMNSLGKANMDRVNAAGVMQSLEEHNQALLQYVKPGQSPAERYMALQMGREAEKQLPAYWNESATRPGHEFQVSSSAVDGIRVTPFGTIEVKWHGGKNPKWYTFGQYENTYEASKAAQELLKADSLGRAVMPWQRKGKVLNFKHPENNYSWWNSANYNAAFA